MRLLVLLALIGACTPRTAPPAPAAAAPAPVAPATLPPPFDAAALRDGFPVGTVMRYRIVEAGVPHVEEWTVTSADPTGCTMHTVTYADDGTTLVSETDHTNTWVELEGHGTFPAATTTRTDATVTVGAGQFATWFYDEAPAEPGGLTRRFHFAPTVVGPPVWAEFRQGDAVVVTMELLSRTNP